ncbi:hypothetical protein G6L37_02940 [Agrobacterium rubi]|nr:hypothetical protein [Agrobacterium rubi]NTF24334.1 hypothetical protein [Agrobacterium rubi]
MHEYIDVIDASGNLTVDVLKAKRFVANGVRFDNIEGEGCISDALNVAYLGTVALMRPSRFLSVAPPDGIRSTNYMAAHERPFGSPYLEVRVPLEDDGLFSIREHEGRSRMSAIHRRHGDIPVPVCLFFNINGYALRAREIETQWIEKASDGLFRENLEGPPEWVIGPIFDQVMFMHNGVEPRLLEFASENAEHRHVE